MNRKSLSGIALMLLFSDCTPVKKWVGDAEVRVFNGLPCFSIESNDLTRLGLAKLVDIQVIGRNGDMWSVTFNPSTNILPDQCVSYGNPMGHFVETLPAKALVPGEQYEVVIGAPMDQYPYEAHFYEAYFFVEK